VSALAPRPLAPLAIMYPPPGPIAAAITALERARAGDREMDALIYEAFGWKVTRDQTARGREWRARGPASRQWVPLPHPTGSLDDSARLVPHRWAWGVGVQRGHPFAWVAERHPLGPGVPFFEGQGLAPALTLCRVALFAALHLSRNTWERT
jgi:hypothetical protein